MVRGFRILVLFFHRLDRSTHPGLCSIRFSHSCSAPPPEGASHPFCSYSLPNRCWVGLDLSGLCPLYGNMALAVSQAGPDSNIYQCAVWLQWKVFFSRLPLLGHKMGNDGNHLFDPQSAIVKIKWNSNRESSWKGASYTYRCMIAQSF